MATIECFNCHQRVSNLKAHKANCRAAPAGRPTTVKCFDCQLQVSDLKSHRRECQKRPQAISSSSQTLVVGDGQKTLFESKTMIAKTVQVSQVSTNSSPSKDVYVLLDVSGSMEGSKLNQAKEGLKEIHQFLREDDRLAIITFDSNAYFKLKPRPNGQVKRQNELPELLDRIFARGGTALYDAIWMGIEQMKDKSRPTLFVVLTDGEDNASQHKLDDILKLVDAHNEVTLDIVEISANSVSSSGVNYNLLAQRGRGNYTLIVETEVVTTLVKTVTKYFK